MLKEESEENISYNPHAEKVPFLSTLPYTEMVV